MSLNGQRFTPLEMLAKLVSFDTVSSKSNLPLIAFVESYLQSWNVPYVRVPNEAGDKAALYATIGPQDRGGIVLSGHTDVVPVTGQAWTSDPFTLRVENGRAYGRGAVDMKAFDALALALVPEFLAADLITPIHIMLSYDEETTCLGVVDTIRRLGHDLPLPEAVIVGEPTMLEVVDAHKSVVTFTTTVHGFEAHSSKPYLGASAVMTAAEIIAELNRIGDDMMARGDTSGRFDPPYTTVHVGIISGGTARNILSKSCSFHWEFRGLPSLDPQEIPDAPRPVRAGGRPQASQPLRRVRPDRDGAACRRAGPRARSRLTRGSAGAASCRQEPYADGALRHGGGALPAQRHSDRRLRAGLDRSGASAGRIHHARPARGRRRLHAAPRGNLRAFLIPFTSLNPHPEEVAQRPSRRRIQCSLEPPSRRSLTAAPQDEVCLC